jgi:c-di-GMP-binding flagellar brake protein YcgR
MSLKSLVLSSDEKIVRVLRRVLNDLEIAVEHCNHPDDAIRILTRQRFEAVIVDCDNREQAAAVLKSVSNSPSNKRAVSVAIVGAHTGLKGAFDMGAHFVLYKPLSAERAKASFRAARALMKRERRRNFRLPIQIPITFTNGQRASTVDFSEGGFALNVSRKSLERGTLHLSFVLPGSVEPIKANGEVAWENANGQTGIRFVDLSPTARHELKTWFNHNAPESEKDDPPVRCRLTDLSLGGCYLEINSPFPINTKIVLSMRVADLELRADGVVRVMHPEIGMGLEFTQSTAEQRLHVERFIQGLMDSQGALPDLQVEPEGLELDGAKSVSLSEEGSDPLLDLFRHKAGMPTEGFLGELRKQRRSHNTDPAETVFEV